MIYFVVDSGKTGYTVDGKRVREIRETYGKEYPDFLMKYNKPRYQSDSIIGILYREAVAYKKGDTKQLDNQFTNLRLNDNQLQNPSPMPLSSLVRKQLALFRSKIFIYFSR